MFLGKTHACKLIWGVQICVGTKVLLFYPICKQKSTTTNISKLNGSKLSRKDIHVEYVVVKVQDVFMTYVVICKYDRRYPIVTNERLPKSYDCLVIQVFED
jgi:hypothetical protein